jgi:hypothetical protein
LLSAPERWAPIAEAPLYEVSTFGRVRREDVAVEAWPNARGYLMVNLELPGRAWPALRALHRLVLETFQPVPDGDLEGLEAHHQDGIKSHNHLDNLAWVTHAENVQHAWDTGLQPRNRAHRDGCLYGHPRAQAYVDPSGKDRRRCARCRRAHYHRAQAATRGRTWLFPELAPARR